MLQWFGASTCRQSGSETFLPCSGGRADVRITYAWIYSKAEKKPGKKSKCYEERMALAVGAEGC